MKPRMEATSSSVTEPDVKDRIWSSSDWASRIEPPPSRAITINEESGMPSPSASAMRLR